MNIYLAKLKEKPVPNVQYKNGASIFLGQHKKEIDELPKKFKIIEKKTYGISKIIFGAYF